MLELIAKVELLDEGPIAYNRLGVRLGRLEATHLDVLREWKVPIVDKTTKPEPLPKIGKPQGFKLPAVRFLLDYRVDRKNLELSVPGIEVGDRVLLLNQGSPWHEGIHKVEQGYRESLLLTRIPIERDGSWTFVTEGPSALTNWVYRASDEKWYPEI